MNYYEMSPYKINRKVAWLRFGENSIVMKDHKSPDGCIVHGVGVFDPCNNPSDAWPIILHTCMSIELAHSDLGDIGTCTIYNPMGADWQCDFTDNANALRAAMICFLKMKDAEK